MAELAERYCGGGDLPIDELNTTKIAATKEASAALAGPSRLAGGKNQKALGPVQAACDDDDNDDGRLFQCGGCFKPIAA